MTTTNKLDLRTCPLPQLCEWVAVEIMKWRKVDGLNGWTCWRCAKGHLWVSEMFATSLDAVAAVERKAREGRLRMWESNAHNTPHQCTLNGKSGGIRAVWYRVILRQNKPGPECSFTAPTEPEARLRAVALAWDATKEGA